MTNYATFLSEKVVGIKSEGVAQTQTQTAQTRGGGSERDNATAEVRRSFDGSYGPLYQIA